MRAIRWLGAFGTGASLTEAADWEQSQTSRQVAAEPLWHGRSLISHAKIGLELDLAKSVFVSGWMRDAWTVTSADGRLVSDQSRRGRKDLSRYRNRDRFFAAWEKTAHAPYGHGEIAVDLPTYSAVVMKTTATAHGKARARRLARRLGLPLRVL
jgi:hypothetical protein